MKEKQRGKDGGAGNAPDHDSGYGSARETWAAAAAGGGVGV